MGKKWGTASADTGDIKSECPRQLYESFMDKKLYKELQNEFIKNIKFQHKSIVGKKNQRKLLFLKRSNFFIVKYGSI